MGGGEVHRHRTAVTDAEERGSFRTGGVHHGPHVVDALLQTRGLARRQAVRKPGAPLVEQDQARESRDPPVPLSEDRVGGRDLEGVEQRRNVDEIDRAVTKNLIRDAEISALGEVRLGPVHR